MKKRLSVVFSVLLLASAVCFSFAGCTPRSEVLKLLNWEFYTEDEGVLDDFEDYYFETTGKKVKVVQTFFTSNENAFTQISSGKKDYDLFCPSDYTIERLIANDLVHELDWDRIENGENIDEFYRMPEYSAYDPGLKYSVPYLSGTFGIMYDPSRGVDRNDMTTWQALWSSKYSGKITMKESMRDSVAVGNIYANLSTLTGMIEQNGYNAAFREELFKTINRFTPANFTQSKLDETRAKLIEQKSVLLGYEGDEGVDNKINGTGNGTVGLYWSCDAGYAMSENQNLEYYVPDEGSNFWIDGFVIPRYAKNMDAAYAFLNYICDVDVAIANMEYSGGCSAIGEAVDEYRSLLEDDEDGFFEGKSEEWKEMYINAILTPDDVLARCAMMQDFGDKQSAVTSMWNGVYLS